MAFASFFIVLVVLFSWGIPIALFSLLQVFLCKKGGKLGLILPVLSFVLSLVMCLSFASFSTVTGGGSVRVTDEYGNVISQEHHQEEHHKQVPVRALAAVGGMFLVLNIPTAVYGGIYLHYKNRQDWKDDLKKMSIEDLG